MTTAPTSPLPSTPSRITTRPSLGQVGYDAYGERPGVHGPWTTFAGDDMPRWGQLEGLAGELTADRWQEAARAIVAEHEQRKLSADWARRMARMLALLRGYQGFTVSPGAQPGTVLLHDGVSHPATVPVELLELAERRQRRHGAARVCLAVLGRDTTTDTDMTSLDESAQDEERVDPFLAGLLEISSATYALAQAKHALSMARDGRVPLDAVDRLVDTVATQLDARVKRLAQPADEPTASES